MCLDARPKFTVNGIEQSYTTAEDLWEALSPTQKLFPEPIKLIFRGQEEDAEWGLTPSVLRTPGSNKPSIRDVMLGTEMADDRVFYENMLLSKFCKYCDQIGIRIPGDSIKLREMLDPQNNSRNFKSPESWPNPELFEVMALAQHHGIPTRLLDWSRNPYVAVYFAASGALKSYKSWPTEKKLVVWVINTENINLYRDHVQRVEAPGSVSPYLAAQSGLFTVQKVSGGRNQAVGPCDLQEIFMAHGSKDILKLTVPVTESVRLYNLCERIGISAATLFPGADGAARAVHDGIYAACARQWLINNGHRHLP